MAVRSQKPWKNPFYVLLLVAGAAFGLTACAYGLAIFREVDFRRRGTQEPVFWLVWLGYHGLKILLAELAVLGVATVAVIGWDDR